MAEEFRLEDPGEGLHEAEILEVHVAEGDEVADGDIILAIETDKAAIEVPAPFTGVIEDLKVAVGDIANVGDVLMTYRPADGDAEASTAEPAKEAASKSKSDQAGSAETVEETDQSGDGQANGDTPEPSKGERGQTTKKAGSGPVPAAPATRRLARELGVDLEAVTPSGPHGRVTPDDVRSASEGGARQDGQTAAPSRKDDAKPTAAGDAGDTAKLPDFERFGPVERTPLRSIRRATARRMAESWRRIPHVTHQDEADITALERWRRKRDEKAEDADLTLTVVLMKALLVAVKAHPRFNASLDEANDEIVLKRHYHFGVAVDTERGLVVPVVRDVDAKSVLELAEELSQLVAKARDGKLARADMQGGTITITNAGPLGGRAFTPIINFPEAAILGLGEARLEPRVRGDIDDYEIKPRLILPVCLAFDHRINDGADAARMASTLVEVLEDPDRLLLAS